MSVEWVPLICDLPCPFRTTCHRSPVVWWGDSGEYRQTVGVRWLQTARDHSASFIQCRVQFLCMGRSFHTGLAYSAAEYHNARADDLSVVGVAPHFEFLSLRMMTV